jgi:hypothetical protein
MSNKPNNKGPIAQIKITRVSWYKNRYYKDRYARIFSYTLITRARLLFSCF